MKGERRIREGIKEHGKRKRSGSVWAIPVIFFCAMLCLIGFVSGAFIKTAKITIAAEDVEILQGEELPALQAKVTAEDDKKVMLDRKQKYSADDLIKELKKGVGYTLVSKADATKEGIYKIQIKLDEKLQKKIDGKWKKRIDLTLKNGEVYVKNPIGTWQKDKFRRYDGTYVTSDFVVSKGKTYYLDADGKKVTGTYKIGLTSYEFDKNGVFIKKGESAVDPDKPMVALTFDDGPGKRTGELLEQLEKYNAHATFFMLGQRISSNPDALKKMKEIGCELGNHSYSHKDLSKQSAEVVKAEIGNTNSKIAAVTGQGATVMRPPYGAISSVVRENVGLPMILWNIDTLDWKTRNAQATIDSVMNNVKDGDIILMHDIHTESVDAALKLIPMLEEKGYQLVTVSELAAAKGVTLQNGEKYIDF